MFHISGGTGHPSDYFTWTDQQDSIEMTISASKLGFTGKMKVRDAWRQQDLGVFDVFETDVPYHGVTLLTVEAD